MALRRVGCITPIIRVILTFIVQGGIVKKSRAAGGVVVAN